MAVLIRMPEVLAGVAEAAIQSWLVEVGDTVTVDSPLAEIETEKAMVEFSGEHAGTIAALLVASGETVEVGQPIVVLRQDGDTDAEVAAVHPTPGHSTPPSVAEASVSPVGSRQFASPIVRLLTRERGIDLAQLVGSGPGGRIVRRDLEAFESRLPLAADSPLPHPPQTGADREPPLPATGGGETIALTGMRKAIARRLTESKATVPHFYLTAHCRVDELLTLRKAVNETAPRKISANDFVLKAAAQALMDVPDSNAVWGGDHIRRFDTADIAVAVSTEGGLLTPVVRGIESLSVSALSATVADLASRAREGRLSQHEIEGGSFSISNLGMFGIEEFSAILNPPQSGILAVGAAAARPVVVDGVLAVGTVMTVTLSADHRVIDGALGAQWLQAFQYRIEHPLTILC